MSDLHSRLILIPSPIAQPAMTALPSSTLDMLLRCDVLVCERIRTTRRWIKPMMNQEAFDRYHFIEIDKHDPRAYVSEAMTHLVAGRTVGIVSEAGLPCVGDPGAALVMAAHKQHISVQPLVGPNSFMLALMSSGFHAQQFTFHGYLPQEDAALRKQLTSLHQAVKKTGYTQIFMEVPYRHKKLIHAIHKTLPKQTALHISVEADSTSAYHKTQPIHAWMDDMAHFDEKVQAVYVLGREE